MLHGVECNLMKMNSMLMRPIGDKLLISITVFPAKVEIAVCNCTTFRAEDTHPQICKAHGIDTSADSKKY